MASSTSDVSGRAYSPHMGSSTWPPTQWQRNPSWQHSPGARVCRNRRSAGEVVAEMSNVDQRGLVVLSRRLKTASPGWGLPRSPWWSSAIPQWVPR